MAVALFSYYFFVAFNLLAIRIEPILYEKVYLHSDKVLKAFAWAIETKSPDFVASTVKVIVREYSEEEDDDEESVCVAVVETPVPVPVSSCALAPRAARHSTHTCRDNMIVLPMLRLSSGKKRRAGGERTTLRTLRGRWWMS